MVAILRLGWRDVADILVISFFIHRLFLLLRGATMLQILVGLVTLRLLLLGSQEAGLVWTSLFLTEVNDWAPFVIIVVFRNEIREALLQASPIRLLVGRPHPAHAIVPADVTEAVFRLARARTGALLVFPNRDRLGDYVREGVALGGRFGAAVLESLFAKESPVHDGAIIIRRGRIERVGTFLPLSRQIGLPEAFGTRHRAALGLTEMCDAVVVVVSEERGEVSVAYRGVVEVVDGPASLEEVLRRRLGGEVGERPPRGWRRELTWQAAGFLLTALLVSAVVLEGLDSDAPLPLKRVSVPIEFRNLPEGLELQHATAERVTIQLRGQRALIDSRAPGQVTAFVDLEGLEAERYPISLGVANVAAPPGLEVVQINPPTLWIDLERRVERPVKVVPQVVGRPADDVQVTARPEMVPVSGPQSVLDNQKARVLTEPIDAHDLGPDRPSKTVTATLVLSPASLRLARGQDKQVQVVVRLKTAPPKPPPPPEEKPGP